MNKNDRDVLFNTINDVIKKTCPDEDFVVVHRPCGNPMIVKIKVKFFVFGIIRYVSVTNIFAFSGVVEKDAEVFLLFRGYIGGRKFRNLIAPLTLSFARQHGFSGTHTTKF